MTISTYAELQTAVQNWLSRTDADTVARIPEWIALCEARIRWGSKIPGAESAPLRCRRMETRTATTVNEEYETLPTDYLGLVRYKLATDPVTNLKILSRNQFDDTYTSSTTAKPLAVTVEGGSFRFGPVPDTAYTGEVFYYADIPDLASNSTNWLLTYAPNVYLYGTLLEACPYIGQDDRINVGTFLPAFNGSVNALNDADNMSVYGGTLVARPAVVF